MSRKEDMELKKDELPDSVDLAGIDVSDCSKAMKYFGLKDMYISTVLWPGWKDNGTRICAKCGFAVDAMSGNCNAEPAHKHKPYKSPRGKKNVPFSSG